MDKFGVFKLLTSFFDYYQKNKDTAPKGNIFDLLNFTNNGVKNGGEGNKAGNQYVNTPTPTLTTTSASEQNKSQPLPKLNKPLPKLNKPLQADMLKTLTTHDNFVKRVKEKHGV